MKHCEEETVDFKTMELNLQERFYGHWLRDALVRANFFGGYIPAFTVPSPDRDEIFRVVLEQYMRT